MKKLLQLVIMVVSLFVLSVSAFAAESLVDNAKLLTAQEKATVQRTLQNVESKYGVRVAVVTIKDSNVKELGKYANQLLDRNYKNGKNGNQLLVINMATKKWNITRDKNMAQKISKDYGAKMLDEKVVKSLSAKKYKDAFVAYADVTGQELEYFKKNGKAISAQATGKPVVAAGTKAAPKAKEKGSSWPMALGGGIVVGALAAYMYGSSLKKSMSNVAFEEQANQYMKEDSFHLTEEDDSFMYFTYARVPKPKHEEEEDDQVEDVSDSSEDSSDDDHDDEGGSF